MISKKLAIFVLFLNGLILISCNGPERELNGYKVSSPYTGMYAIINADSVEVIQPNLRKLGVSGGNMYGECIPHIYSDGFETPGGYFILDTNTGLTTEGMTLSEMSNLLYSKYGVSSNQIKLKVLYKD